MLNDCSRTPVSLNQIVFFAIYFDRFAGYIASTNLATLVGTVRLCSSL